jgi:hypothetical protein
MTGGQMDMFGGPDAPVQGPVIETSATNDLDLIESVIRVARETGYVVMGPGEQVYHRDFDGGLLDGIELAPGYEAEAVHQLIRRGLLTIGGGHTVSHEGHSCRADAVLVPRKTRDMAGRWRAYVPINGKK